MSMDNKARREQVERIITVLGNIRQDEAEGNPLSQLRTRVWLGQLVATVGVDVLCEILQGWKVELLSKLSSDADKAYGGKALPTLGEIADATQAIQSTWVDDEDVLIIPPNVKGRPRKKGKRTKLDRECRLCGQRFVSKTKEAFCQRCQPFTERSTRKMRGG